MRDIARQLGGDAVTTIGTLDVTPNIVNAIPGRVKISIDVRDPKTATLDRARAMVDAVVKPASGKV